LRKGDEHFRAVFFTTEPDGWATTRCKILQKNSTLRVGVINLIETTDRIAITIAERNVGMGIPMGIPMGMGMGWVWGLKFNPHGSQER